MELFKHRNLAFGCGCFLVLLFASFYFNTAARIATLIIAGIAILLLTVILLRLRTPRVVTLCGKALPALLLSVIAMVLSISSFDKSYVFSIDEAKEHQITATVLDCQYSSGYFNIYTADMSTLNGEDFDEDIKLITYGATLNNGDVVDATGYFTHITDDSNKGDGIVTSFEAEIYTVIGNKPFPVRNFFEKANLTLSTALDGLNEDTSSLLGALVLGNKEALDPQVRRDFSKIGLAHILALSGMHISIIITLFSFFLERIRIRRAWKEVILIFVTLIFVGITGFSNSALRAGFMVVLTLILSFVGNRLSMASALFFSVTIICIIDPYSIFSVSLLLSFFAMLGCLAASRIVRGLKLRRTIRSRILRYVAVSFITTATALIFTMPVVYLVFGYVSLLSPLTNLLFSPVFTLLIYVTPFYMATFWIPFISDVVGWVLEKLCALVLSVGKWIASFDNTVIPLKSYVQIIGIILAVSCLAVFLVGGRKIARKMVCGALLGVLVFAVGTGIFIYDRNTSTYAGALSNESSDVVFLEDAGELTIFQLGSSYSLCRSAMLELGYHYEIENLVITDYHKNTLSTILYLSNCAYVKNVYLPLPLDQYEEETYNRARALASERGITAHKISELRGTKSTEIVFSEKAKVAYSDVRTVAFSITSQSTKFTYLGKNANHLYDNFTMTEPQLSDVIVFGSAGPSRDTQYYYDTPHLDLCIFLGGSEENAAKELWEQVSAIAITDKTELSRIKFPD